MAVSYAMTGRSRVRSALLQQVLFAIVVIVGSMFFGLIAYSGNPWIIALAVGCIAGPAILLRPQWAMTVMLALGLTMGMFLSFAGGAVFRIGWALSMLGFLLFFLAALQIPRTRLPPFVVVALVFVALAGASTVAQWHGLAEVVAGVKRYLQAFGLLLAAAVLPLTVRQFAQWRLLVLGIALLQLPAAALQFLVLVPKRGGLEAGATTTDVVAGTFGASLTGGSPNSVMVVFLLIVIAFMLSRWKEREVSTGSCALVTLICVSPLFLGEVKIALVMLPITILVVMREEVIRRPLLFIAAAVGGTLLTAAVGYVYLEWIINKPLWMAIDDTLAYNLYDKGHGLYYLNRTTVLKFWWQMQQLGDPAGFLFGHGMGSSFITADTFVPGHLAAKWPRYGIGLTAASSLLWDTGVLGFSAFIGILVTAWFAGNKIRKSATPAWMRADALAIQAALILFAVLIFYNSAMVDILSMEIIASMILGYLAFLYRLNGAQSVSDDDPTRVSYS